MPFPLLLFQLLESSIFDSLSHLRFYCIFKKSGKTEATDLAVSQLRGTTIAIISAHVPGQHIWASAGPGLSSSSPNSGIRMFALRLTTLSVRDRH